MAAPAIDASDNLLGTTKGYEATGGGTVFEVTPQDNESVLYAFEGGRGHTGFSPIAGVILDQSGNLYGTTGQGGYKVRYPGVVYQINR